MLKKIVKRILRKSSREIFLNILLTIFLSIRVQVKFQKKIQNEIAPWFFNIFLRDRLCEYKHYLIFVFLQKFGRAQKFLRATLL